MAPSYYELSIANLIMTPHKLHDNSPSHFMQLVMFHVLIFRGEKLLSGASNLGMHSMRSDSRLSRMLHVLIHMNRHHRPITSDVIARMLSTNPVVVRRTMAGLRNRGYVQSEKGHGGGWTLIVKLNEITLLDVYRSLGDSPIFALGLANDRPQCLVEQAVNVSLGGVLQEVETLLLARLSEITVGDLAREFDKRLKNMRQPSTSKEFS